LFIAIILKKKKIWFSFLLFLAISFISNLFLSDYTNTEILRRQSFQIDWLEKLNKKLPLQYFIYYVKLFILKLVRHTNLSFQFGHNIDIKKHTQLN